MVLVHQLASRAVQRIFPRAGAAWGSVVLVAGFLLLAFGVGSIADFHIRPDIVATSVEQEVKRKLPDGSVLWLAPQTEVRVLFVGRFRNLTLVRGEANFEVAHGDPRPFQVFVSGRVIRAVGTSFNIRHRSSETTEVVVTEGSVAVFDKLVTGSRALPSSAIRVKAGQGIVLTEKDGGTVQHIASEKVDSRLGWQRGQLVFEGQPLSEVIRETNLFSSRQFVIEDPSIANVKIGGTFSVSNLGALIDVLPWIGVQHRIVMKNGKEEIHLYGGDKAEEYRRDSPPP